MKKYYNNPLYVDSWTITYKPIVCYERSSCLENVECCDYNMMELYDGKKGMEQVDRYKYLGHHISDMNNNSAHIEEIKKKSLGIIQKIMSNLRV